MLRYWKPHCLLPFVVMGVMVRLLCMLFYFCFFCFMRSSPSLSSLPPSSPVSSLPNPRVSPVRIWKHLFLPSCADLTFMEASSVLLAYCLDSHHLLDWTCFSDWTACWYQLCLIDGCNFLAVSFWHCSLSTGGFICRRNSWLQSAEMRRWPGRTAWGCSNPAAQIAQLIDQFQCLEACLHPPKGWIGPKYHGIMMTLS